MWFKRAGGFQHKLSPGRRKRFYTLNGGKFFPEAKRGLKPGGASDLPFPLGANTKGTLGTAPLDSELWPEPTPRFWGGGQASQTRAGTFGDFTPPGVRRCPNRGPPLSTGILRSLGSQRLPFWETCWAQRAPNFSHVADLRQQLERGPVEDRLFLPRPLWGRLFHRAHRHRRFKTTSSNTTGRFITPRGDSPPTTLWCLRRPTLWVFSQSAREKYHPRKRHPFLPLWRPPGTFFYRRHHLSPENICGGRATIPEQPGRKYHTGPLHDRLCDQPRVGRRQTEFGALKSPRTRRRHSTCS